MILATLSCCCCCNDDFSYFFFLLLLLPPAAAAAFCYCRDFAAAAAAAGGCWWLLVAAGGCWLLVAAAAAAAAASAWSKDSSRMGKHHGSEGRRSFKIAPQKCLTQLLKPIEKDDFNYFFLNWDNLFEVKWKAGAAVTVCDSLSYPEGFLAIQEPP